MGMFDGLLGGVVGAEMALVVNGLIEKHGGVQGIVAQLEQQGLGGTVRSWVGTGTNQPISPDQIHQAFGADTVKQLAAKIGISPEDLAAKLSQVLPQAIDKLTPGGVAVKTPGVGGAGS
jgi:uncharacterized protein YidB (DUF937 family)